MIRVFDLLISIIALIILFPFFLVIAIAIKLNSRGNIFFKQQRVGKNNIDFELYKFRSMRNDADKKGLLTVGMRDARITSVGYFLRKYKLDELPQLINVVKGEMSIVGPRPEVRKYVNFYSADQLTVLNILPGITDYASIEFKNENDLLSNAKDPEQFYIDVILPQKIKLNQRFIENRNLRNYIKIIFKTVFGILGKAAKA
jgi:lipopolysaccharide/colanic/teichoic acid biosynthesis glycosyltransferase